MRKKVLFVVVVFVFALAGIYLFIPGIVTLNNNISIYTSEAGLHRLLAQPDSAAGWWPGTILNKDGRKILVLEEDSFRFFDNGTAITFVNINHKERTIQAPMYVESKNTELQSLQWVSAIKTSVNPISRIARWRYAALLDRKMKLILKSIGNYLSTSKNLYGIDVKKELVKDTLLISTASISNGFPTTDFIYSNIDKLEKYATGQGAKKDGFPMLFVEPLDSSRFSVHIGLPVNKSLPNTVEITEKRMPRNGNMLTATVIGSLATNLQACKQLLLYANDYKRSSMAIPYISLITDRRAEKDSTRWVTKIYCPVM